MRDAVDALHDLLLLHADDPTWALREGTTRALSRAMRRGDEPLTARVAALLSPREPSPALVPSSDGRTTIPSEASAVSAAEPLLETLARAASAAIRDTASDAEESPAWREALLEALAACQSVLARHLAAEVAPTRVGPPQPPAPLPAAFRLHLPTRATFDNLLTLGGRTGTRLRPTPSRVLGPYARPVVDVARLCGLDPAVLLARAAVFAADAAASSPDEHAVRDLLTRAGPKLAFVPPSIAAARTGVLRLLDELDRAAILPATAGQASRTAAALVDLDLVDLPLTQRPARVPGAETGLRLTSQQWADRADARLSEYTAQADSDRSVNDTDARYVLGGLVSLRLLNWGEWTENYTCNTWTTEPAQPPTTLLTSRGIFQPSQPYMPQAENLRLVDVNALQQDNALNELLDRGEPLLLESSGWVLHTPASHWVALRPEIASACGWAPDSRQIGAWRTATGQLAAETTWWQDGRLDTAPPSFDDVVGAGTFVLVTRTGLNQLHRTLGPLVRAHQVRRSAHGSGYPKRDRTASTTMSFLILSVPTNELA